MNSVQQVDFLVVGAGPIGASLALSLAQISPQLSVVLVDHSPELINSPERINSPELINSPEKDSASEPDGFPQFDTRVFAINSGSKALLQRVGAWQMIRTSNLCAYQRMHVWDSEGTGSVTFNARELDVSALGHIVEARAIQQALNTQIASVENIQVYRPVQVVRFVKQTDSCQIELNSGEQFSVKLVCAADGARSAMRDLASIAVSQDNCHQQAMVANIKLSRSHEQCAWQIFRPTGPLAFLPLPWETETYCSIVWSLDSAEAERIKALDVADFLQALERAVEGRFGSLELISDRQSFSLQQQHAADYGMPGMVLVGDAAHSVHPLAGLGANLGFQDVTALSEEVSRAYQRGIDFGHERVISRYQRQRKVDNEMVIQAMKLFRLSFADQGMHLNALRNLGMKVFSVTPGLKKLAAQHAFMAKAN